MWIKVNAKPSYPDFCFPVAYIADMSYADNYSCVINTTYFLTRLRIKISNENFTIRQSYLRFLKFVLVQKLQYLKHFEII